MRVRLTSSAATWTIRAELLERLEARRGSIAREAPSDEAGENDNG